MLVECLKSILNQTFKNIEIIIIDDGSTDGTSADISSLSSKIKYFKVNNCGNPAFLRNYGIENSIGDLIAFCDDDDIWYPKKLEAQLNFIADYDFICTNADFIDSAGKKLDFKYYLEFDKDGPLKIEHLFIRNFVITSSVLVKREILPFGNFDVKRTKSMAEDYDLWLKISLNKSIFFMKDCFILYRIHTDKKHIGENYYILLRNTIDLLNKFKMLVPKVKRKYAIWGVFKFRIYYMKIVLKEFKIVAFLKELIHLAIDFMNNDFLILFFKRIFYGKGFVFRSIEENVNV